MLICLIASLSRKIARTQQNVQTTQRNISELTDAVSAMSSVVAIVGMTMGVFKNIRQGVANKRAKYGKKTGKK